MQWLNMYSSELYFLSKIRIDLNVDFEYSAPALKFSSFSEVWFSSLIMICNNQAKQKKMFVCENPGGQKNIHQAGRESIFFA